MSNTKNDRLRGKRSHGTGNTKNHRGAGSKGGRGRAGSFKHKFSKFYPVLGKRKIMKPRLKGKTKLREITIYNLDLLIKDAKEVNLKELGYDKVIGFGKITKAITLKNAKVTAVAKQKIEAAGGKVE